MKRQIVKKSQIKKTVAGMKFVAVNGAKVKLYWWTELHSYYYWTKNGKPVPATVIG